MQSANTHKKTKLYLGIGLSVTVLMLLLAAFLGGGEALQGKFNIQRFTTPSVQSTQPRDMTGGDSDQIQFDSMQGPTFDDRINADEPPKDLPPVGGPLEPAPDDSEIKLPPVPTVPVNPKPTK